MVGEEYNEVLKQWVKRDFSIWVGIEDNGILYLGFSGDAGLGYATVSDEYDQDELDIEVDMIAQLLLTSKEWASVAKRNQADTSRKLGCFPHYFGICPSTGIPEGRGQMGLRFFSNNNGQTSGLIIDMIDNKNMFKRATIYFGLPEIEVLIGNMQRIGQTLVKAKEMARKQQDLFKPLPKATPKQ